MRDPKTNPQAGDVLHKGTITRTVVSRNDNEIVYDSRMGRRGCWITTWQEWSRNAEVLKVAE